MTKTETTFSVPLPSLQDRIARGNAMIERVGNDVAIINLTTHQMSTLNQLGARIWDLLDEPRSVGECADLIASGFDVPVEKVRADTQSFVGALLKRGLLVQE